MSVKPTDADTRAEIAAFAQQYGRAAARKEYDLTEGQLGGLLYRYYHVKHSQLFNVKIAPGKPITVKGDAMVISDVHVPCTNWDLAQRMCEIAIRYLPEPRTLIVAGDLFNLDWASTYPAIADTIQWKQEQAAASALIEEWLTVFHDIVLTAGNHDRRGFKATSGNIWMDDLRKLITADKRVRTSEWGHSILRSGGREFRVTHGRNYSVQTGNVGNDMAHKFDQHIILCHQHHGSISPDRYKRYIVVDNPALVDQKKLAYVTLDDSKAPNMGQGFTLVREGEPTLFLEGLTVWKRWLPKEIELKVVSAEKRPASKRAAMSAA